MATRKPAPKPAPAPRRRPVPPPRPPIDIVRDPGFGSAMDELNYRNLLADQRARMLANQPPVFGRPSSQGQFTQGRLMGAPTNQPIPPGGGLGGLTADQAGISPEQRKILDDLMARQAQQPIPPSGGMGGPAPDQNAENIQREFGRYALGINKLMQEQPQQGPQQMSTIAGPMPKSTIAGLRPAGQMNPQQMQAFENFLQQGMQRSNTMNQDAAAGLANLQPGMQPTQPAMPVAGMGMGMQQPRQAPAPRKFSTVRNTPARLG